MAINYYTDDAYAPAERRDLNRHPPLIWDAYQDAKQHYQQAQESGAQLTGWDAMEAGSVGDFGAFLRIQTVRVIIETFKMQPSDAFKTLTEVRSVNDFKPTAIYRIGALGDMLEVPESGEYKDTQLKSVVGATTQLRKYGRVFGFPLEVWYNDDANALTLIPRELGRQFGRLRNKLAIRASITANPALYDGRNMFNSTDGNLGSTALTADITGANALVAGYQAALATFKDEAGEFLGFTPRFLLVSRALEVTANILVTAPTITNGTTLVTNPAPYTGLKVVVEPSLTDTDDWFILPDPNEFPLVYTDFLRGQQEPTIIRTSHGGQILSGGAGEDPFTALNDTYQFKARMAMTATPIDRRGAYGSLID